MNLNKILNILFVINIPCYIWDWYNYLVLGDQSNTSKLSLTCLTIFYMIDIPSRIVNYKKFKTIWYE